MQSHIEELERARLTNIYLPNGLLYLLPIDFRNNTSSDLYAVNSPLIRILLHTGSFTNLSIIMFALFEVWYE